MAVSPLSPEDFLLAEFNYIAQTAFQANEDRSRVSNFYYVTAGAAIGAILSASFRVEPAFAAGVYAGLCGLFLVLTGVGLLTLLQLARLRSAWEDSARAMNTIKDYVLQNSDLPGLDAAFLWRMSTIPQVVTANRRNVRTIAFLLALSILAITIATIAASVVYFSLALYAANPWAPNRFPNPLEGLLLGSVAVALGVLGAILEFRLYEHWIIQAERARQQHLRDHYARFQKYLPELPS